MKAVRSMPYGAILPYGASALRGGESENQLILRMSSTDRLHEMWMRGEGGSKIS